MKYFLSIIVPVLNESKNLDALLPALAKQKWRHKTQQLEIIFIDNGSKDNSLLKLRSWLKSRPSTIKVSILTEKKRGFPYPLNTGIAKAKSDKIACLDADCIPHDDWADTMAQALDLSDIVVGETLTLNVKSPSDAQLLAKEFFHDYSNRAAHGENFALPWGPACNLGFFKNVFEAVGNFSGPAGAAFDMDWCWRALFLGAQISYAKNVVVQHQRRESESAFLQQMYRYGTGEAWIQKSFGSILVGAENNISALERALLAAERLESMEVSAKQKPLLHKAAISFACGVHAGYQELLKSKIPTPKQKVKRIAWKKNNLEICVFIPGKGVLDLSGPGIFLWEAFAHGAKITELAYALTREYSLSEKEAQHEAKEFWQAMQI